MMKQQVATNKIDFFWWSLAVILAGVGVAVNQYYHSVAWGLRAAGWLVLIGLVLALLLSTSHGKRVWAFAKDGRRELRKVVWPNREETIQTTMVVVALVIVMALLMWGLDSVLLWAIGWLTGQRG